jgi:peptide/nickel transport system ATP-binding protein
MSLVSHFSDRLLVMYAAQVAEFGDTRQLFDQPRHPYTRALLEAFPSINGPRVHLGGIPGSPPDLARLPEGCRFSPRCPHVMARCLAVDPPLFDVERDLVRCILYENGAAPKLEPVATGSKGSG